jgi:predicted NUDIX family NTP pyrophosphohydrolase
MMERVSAGILLYRLASGRLEVLLGHPGRPASGTRGEGRWTIPKGEVEPGETLEDVARREFEEETGHALGSVPLVPLGQTRQGGGKLVHAWAAEGDVDPAHASSNTYVVEWPPASGRLVEVTEIDRVAWFAPDAARRVIKPGQEVFIDRLEASLGGHPHPGG